MTNDKHGTLVVIVGPTGSGKTDISIEIARRLGAPIISTDSRQVFRNMAIGTAQPTPEQLAAVRHYFIADREVSDDYNAGRFEREALELLEHLFTQHKYVVAVGGSGLYVDALCRGFDNLPQADPELRSKLEQKLRDEGLSALLDDLQKLDPQYYDMVDRNNPSRVLRAVEVCMQTGLPYSAQRSGTVAERPFHIVKLGVTMPRDILYDRINRRVDLMIEAGLEEEARRLYHLKGLNALMTVGYREMFDYFDGNISRDEAIELIKRNTRRYAKRQMTWFGKDKEINWLGTDANIFYNFLTEKFAD